MKELGSSERQTAFFIEILSALTSTVFDLNLSLAEVLSNRAPIRNKELAFRTVIRAISSKRRLWKASPEFVGALRACVEANAVRYSRSAFALMVGDHGLPFDDEDIDLIDAQLRDRPQWNHVRLTYRMLRALVSAGGGDSSCDPDQHLKLYLYSPRFLIEICQLFYSPAHSDRKELKRLLYALYVNAQVSQRALIRTSLLHLINEHCSDSVGSRLYGLPELLSVLERIIPTMPKRDLSERSEVYRSIICVVRTAQFPSVYSSLSACLCSLSLFNAALALLVFERILRVWPTTSSEHEIFSLYLLQDLLPFVIGETSAELSQKLLSRVKMCLKSPRFRLCEQVLRFIGSTEMDRFCCVHYGAAWLPEQLLSSDVVRQHWHHDIQMLFRELERTYKDSHETSTCSATTKIFEKPSSRRRRRGRRRSRPREQNKLDDSEESKFFGTDSSSEFEDASSRDKKWNKKLRYHSRVKTRLVRNPFSRNRKFSPPKLSDDDE